MVKRPPFGREMMCTNQQGIRPKRVLHRLATIRFLDRFKAEKQQYLHIKHPNGTLEHVPGLCSIYLSLTWHGSIEMKNGISLNEKSAICKDSSHPGGSIIGAPNKESSQEDYNLTTSTHSYYFVRDPTVVIPLENERAQVTRCDTTEFLTAGGRAETARILHKSHTINATTPSGEKVPSQSMTNMRNICPPIDVVLG
jgi:hypothetical protein